MRFNTKVLALFAASLTTSEALVRKSKLKKKGVAKKGHIKSVLLLSIDGLHYSDLVQLKKDPVKYQNFNWLMDNGLTFPKHKVSTWADSFPGLSSMLTGAGPGNSGLLYDFAYSRKLVGPVTGTGNGGTDYNQPTGIQCIPGQTENLGWVIGWDESIDVDYENPNTNAIDPTYLYQAIDPKKLPRDPANNCNVVYPHNWMVLNTIFEVAKGINGAKGIEKSWTAWTDKNPGYEWVNGPSGKGVDDFFNPEVSSFDKKNIFLNKEYDTIKLNAILNWIHGKMRDGTDFSPRKDDPPVIYGGNFVILNDASKYLDLSPTSPAIGADYVPGTQGEFSPKLADVFEYLDGNLGQIKDALVATGNLEETMLIVTAKHGNSPIDKNLLHKISVKTSNCPGNGGTDECSPASLLLNDVTLSPYLANYIEDTVSLIWLTPESGSYCKTPGCDKTADAVKVLLDSMGTGNPAGIFKIYSGDQLFQLLKANGDLAADRVPDILIETLPGVVYTDKKKVMEHGGFSTDDRSVALIFSNPLLKLKGMSNEVASTHEQIAATILDILGVDYKQLQGYQVERADPLSVY